MSNTLVMLIFVHLFLFSIAFISTKKLHGGLGFVFCRFATGVQLGRACTVLASLNHKKENPLSRPAKLEILEASEESGQASILTLGWHSKLLNQKSNTKSKTQLVSHSGKKNRGEDCLNMSWRSVKMSKKVEFRPAKNSNTAGLPPAIPLPKQRALRTCLSLPLTPSP